MCSRYWLFVLSFLLYAMSPPSVLASSGTLLAAGTPVNVRTTQTINADTAHVGMMVDALVDDPVDTGGHVIIPRGAHAVLEVVRVEESSNLKGRDRITLKLHALRVGPRVYPVAANHVEFTGPSEGKRARNKILGGAGVGGLVGGLLGGGTQAPRRIASRRQRVPRDTRRSAGGSAAGCRTTSTAIARCASPPLPATLAWTRRILAV